MSSKYANSTSRLIVFLIYPGVTLLDVTGPAQVFASANVELAADTPHYETVIASKQGGLIRTDTGVEINTVALNSTSNIDTIVVAGGSGIFDTTLDIAVVDWLRTNMPLAQRTISTCMGTFLMAETGLLGTQTVTTHWRWIDELQERYRELNVVCGPIFVKEGAYASSAGVTTGIDLALSLVEDDHNRQIALAVAKSLVLYLRRSGTQQQFSHSLLGQLAEQSGRFDDLNYWIEQNLTEELTVETLADKAGMSARNFSRAYSKHVGLSPAKAVEHIRFEKARLMLETTSLPVKSIALETGFKDYERMRRTFLRLSGVTPRDYRQRFGL